MENEMTAAYIEIIYSILKFILLLVAVVVLCILSYRQLRKKQRKEEELQTLIAKQIMKNINKKEDD